MGVEGNTRLTAVVGIVLLGLEGITILSVRQMITLHVFVGVLLIGPVLLKTVNTVYRTRSHPVRAWRRSFPAGQLLSNPHGEVLTLGPPA